LAGRRRPQRCRRPCSGSRLLPRPEQRGGGASPSLSKPARAGGWREENPKGVGGLASVPRRPGAPFERRPHSPRDGFPPLPPAARWVGAGGSRGGRPPWPRMLAERGSRVFYFPPAVKSDPAHAPALGVRAGWAVRPRPAPRELVRRDRWRKGGSVTRRVGADWRADTRAPSVRGRESKVGCAD
jgi:hypothetical protein